MVEDDGVNRGGVESDGAREGVTGEGSAEEEPVQIKQHDSISIQTWETTACAQLSYCKINIPWGLGDVADGVDSGEEDGPRDAGPANINQNHSKCKLKWKRVIGLGK